MSFIRLYQTIKSPKRLSFVFSITLSQLEMRAVKPQHLTPVITVLQTWPTTAGDEGNAYKQLSRMKPN